jgi:histone H3/H4
MPPGGWHGCSNGRHKTPAMFVAGKEEVMDMLLVGSKTKEALKKHGCNVGGDALDALNMVLHWYVEQGAKRAAANGRKTVRAHDFIIGG